MNKKSSLTAGKFVISLAAALMLPLLFTGCGEVKKTFASQEDVNQLFQKEAENILKKEAESKPYLASMKIKQIIVENTGKDNFNVDLEITASDKAAIFIHGTGTYNGESCTLNFSEKELNNLNSLHIKNAIFEQEKNKDKNGVLNFANEKTSISELNVKPVDDSIYRCMIKLSSGRIQLFSIQLDTQSGKIFRIK